jgi:hypothetical protein
MTSDLIATGPSRAVPGGVTTFQVASPDLEAVVCDLRGLRLADMFASDGDTPTLRMVWATDAEERQSGYVITETPIENGKYPALSDIAPAAFVEECEIYEQFGIRPATGKPLNRIMLPPHTDLPTLGRKPPSEPEEVRAPHTVAGQAFEFPFGPVRQAGVESLYYGLVTSGEEVVDLYLFTWHKHRGLEWRLRGKTPQEALFYAERAEGPSPPPLRPPREPGRPRRRSAPAPLRSNWSGCTTTPPPWRRCASRPGCPLASRPPRSPLSGSSG